MTMQQTSVENEDETATGGGGHKDGGGAHLGRRGLKGLASCCYGNSI